MSDPLIAASSFNQMARRHIIICEDGAALLEFALILPVIIALSIGCVEVGRILHAYAAVENAVRGGARFLAQVPNPSCNPTCSWGARRAIALTRDEIMANTSARDTAIRVTLNEDALSDEVTIAAEVEIAAMIAGKAGVVPIWTVKVSGRERRIVQ